MKKNEKDCPCYTCVVQACCVGAEPSLKEKERWSTSEYQEILNEHFKEDDQMEKEIKELEDKWDIYLDWTPKDQDFSIPELEAQRNCDLYCKWANILEEL